MFEVCYKDADELDCNCETFTVYHIRDDKNGYPCFLIFENGEWRYRSAKLFKEYTVNPSTI